MRAIDDVTIQNFARDLVAGKEHLLKRDDGSDISQNNVEFENGGSLSLSKEDLEAIEYGLHFASTISAKHGDLVCLGDKFIGAFQCNGWKVTNACVGHCKQLIAFKTIECLI